MHNYSFPQIVTLECPYDQLQNKLVQRLISQTFALKIEGYQESYPYGVLPTDTYDFIATHHLACERSPQGLIPIMAYKTVTLERCRVHRLPFPGVTVLRSSGAHRHADELEKFLASAESNQKSVSYGSSWTLSPRVRADRESARYFKDLMASMLIQYEQGLSTNFLFTCGVLKVKTNQFFESLGYQRLCDSENVQLPPFKQASLIGDEAVVLWSNGFKPEAVEQAQRFKSLWKSRLILDSRVPEKTRRAA